MNKYITIIMGNENSIETTKTNPPKLHIMMTTIY